MNAYVIALLAVAQPTAEPEASPVTPETVLDVPAAETLPDPDPSAPTSETVLDVPTETTPSERPATDDSRSRSRQDLDPDTSEATRRAAATKHVRQADTLFRESRYDEALSALDMAERQWPDPAHHFMRGTIEKKRGRCDEAKRAFERFLDRDPPALDADVARAQIRECQDAAAPVSLVPTFEAGTPDTPPPPPTEPWVRDVPGGVLFGVGVAGTMVGAGFLIANRLDTEVPVMYDEFTELGRRRGRRQRIGTGLVVASSTLVAAAIIRYVWVGRRNRKARQLATAHLFAPEPAVGTALIRW